MSNIIYHIEMPWVNEFGADAGCILAAETGKKCLNGLYVRKYSPVSFGVTEMREVYRDIIFGAPDGELPEGFEFVKPEGQEVLL